jgi:acetyltransferase
VDIKAFGLQEPKSIIAQTAQEAVRFADEIGYPVVLKINSPDIMHKTDIGGVRVGVANAQEVESAFSEIMDNASRHYPIENLNGV